MIVLAVLAASAAPVAVATQDPDTVIRCVREEVTGSLVGSKRVCHTVGEWRRIRSDANDEVRRMMQPGTLNDLNRDPDPGAAIGGG